MDVIMFNGINGFTMIRFENKMAAVRNGVRFSRLSETEKNLFLHRICARAACPVSRRVCVWHDDNEQHFQRQSGTASARGGAIKSLSVKYDTPPHIL